MVNVALVVNLIEKFLTGFELEEMGMGVVRVKITRAFVTFEQLTNIEKELKPYGYYLDHVTVCHGIEEKFLCVTIK